MTKMSLSKIYDECILDKTIIKKIFFVKGNKQLKLKEKVNQITSFLGSILLRVQTFSRLPRIISVLLERVPSYYR